VQTVFVIPTLHKVFCSLTTLLLVQVLEEYHCLSAHATLVECIHSPIYMGNIAQKQDEKPGIRIEIHILLLITSLHQLLLQQPHCLNLQDCIMINFVDCIFDVLCIVLCIPFGVVCMYACFVWLHWKSVFFSEWNPCLNITITINYTIHGLKPYNRKEIKLVPAAL